MKIEKHGCLPFFNVLVSKVHSGFETNIFHKATDTGLGLKFDSAVSSKYKLNLIDCLLDRDIKSIPIIKICAVNLSSSESFLVKMVLV